MRRAFLLAEKLQAGTVWVNTYRAVSYRFMITGHVMEEITDHYPEQQVRLNAALADGTLEVVTVSGDATLNRPAPAGQTNPPHPSGRL